jgi:putative SOS response-associated peptidase YedK
MCYWYGQRVSREEYIRLKDLEAATAGLDDLFRDVQGGFDFQNSLVIRAVPGKREIEAVPMEWGFVPFHIRTPEQLERMRKGYKDEQGKWHTAYDMQNARSEELFISAETGREKAYAKAARERRCLVPLSGFFEWRHIYRTNKRTGEPVKTPDKYPYHIHVKEKPYFFVPGIWQSWTDTTTGEMRDTFAIITTAANPLMAVIHNSKRRMPTILPDELAYEWLFGDLADERITQIATYQLPADQMEACTVQKEFKTALQPTEAFSYADVPAITF